MANYFKFNVLDTIKHYTEELDDSVRPTLRMKKIFLTKSKKKVEEVLNDLKSVNMYGYMYGEKVTPSRIRDAEFEIKYINEKILELSGTNRQ